MRSVSKNANFANIVRAPNPNVQKAGISPKNEGILQAFSTKSQAFLSEGIN